jgi:hypothetical protein
MSRCIRMIVNELPKSATTLRQRVVSSNDLARLQGDSGVRQGTLNSVEPSAGAIVGRRNVHDRAECYVTKIQQKFR